MEPSLPLCLFSSSSFALCFLCFLYTLDNLLFVRFNLLFFSSNTSLQKRELLLQLTCLFLCVNIDTHTHKFPGRDLLDSLQIFRRLERETGKRGRSVRTFHLLAREGNELGAEENRGGEGQHTFFFEDLCSRRKEKGGSQHEKSNRSGEGDK